MLATSWNILSGYSGYFSFGHGAFFGAGMYTTAVLATRYDVPFLWTLPAAAAIAALLGLALGAVVFRVRRVRGELFALATLAFTFVVGTLVLNTPIDGGPGIALSGVAVPKLGPSASSSFYLLALALAIVTLVTALAISRAKLGTGLFAIHDDEDAAEVLGVPTFRYKLAAFAVSCAFAGVAGGLQALFVSYVTVSETFSITVPLSVVLMSVLGGTRHWAGPAVGATLITGLLYAFTTGDHALLGKAVFGAVLIVAILFMPNGVLGWLVARRRPRVLADRREPAPASPPVTPRATSNDALLVARDVRKAFRGVQALDGVSLTVREGEILALLGPNGSGKSTFINVVSGHYRPDAGSIRFAGHEIAGWPAHRIARAGIARTYQIPRPLAHLSVLANVALPAMFGAAALDAADARREGAALARVHRPCRVRAMPARGLEPAPAQVPRARPCARVASAPVAAGRGAVRPDTGRDQRCRRADSRHPGARCDDRFRRARHARGGGVVRSPRGARPRRGPGRRRGVERPCESGRRCRVPRSPACLSSRASR